MPRKRKNKAEWVGASDTNQEWFLSNVRRQRTRNKIAKQSRKKNRGKS